MTVSKDLNHLNIDVTWAQIRKCTYVVEYGKGLITCWQTACYSGWWSSLDFEADGEERDVVQGCDGAVGVDLPHCVHLTVGMSATRRVETSFPETKWRTLYDE